MFCPTCNKSFHPQPDKLMSYYDEKSQIGFEFSIQVCPACNEYIIILAEGTVNWDVYGGSCVLNKRLSLDIIYPNQKDSGIFKIASEVPSEYKNDLLEAHNILQVSPKASAALSRRLLQKVLREKLGIVKKDLWQEIEEFISNEKAPTYLADAIDAIRHIGNFAAHPIKYQNTGEIVDVENGEAEWLIEIMESLFDFVFVQPTKLEARRAALNSKLKELGKPELKGS